MDASRIHDLQARLDECEAGTTFALDAGGAVLAAADPEHVRETEGDWVPAAAEALVWRRSPSSVYALLRRAEATEGLYRQMRDQGWEVERRRFSAR